MKAKLVCTFGKLMGKEIPLSKEMTIGKDPENMLVIQEKYISRRHARIYFDKQRDSYFIEDLKSRNGTKLDGERVRSKERLAHLHVITLGKRLEFFFVNGQYDSHFADGRSASFSFDLSLIELDFWIAKKARKIS